MDSEWSESAVIELMTAEDWCQMRKMVRAAASRDISRISREIRFANITPMDLVSYIEESNLEFGDLNERAIEQIAVINKAEGDFRIEAPLMFNGTETYVRVVFAFDPRREANRIALDYIYEP